MASDPTDLIREGRAYADALALQQGKFEAADIMNRILDALEASEEKYQRLDDAGNTVIRMMADEWQKAEDERDEARAALAEANATIQRVKSLADEWEATLPGDDPFLDACHPVDAENVCGANLRRAIEGPAT